MSSIKNRAGFYRAFAGSSSEYENTLLTAQPFKDNPRSTIFFPSGKFEEDYISNGYGCFGRFVLGSGLLLTSGEAAITGEMGSAQRRYGILTS
ncbi:MAG: hypothetical protein OS112_09815 [Methanoregula sp.]|nr:MAG: hypothetical protein OS112_09815 [Methanoregula sp.]